MTTNRKKVSHKIRTSALIASAVVLVACDNKQPGDTKDSLAHDPDRLKAVMQDCHNHPERGNDTQCRLAADAYRERFLDRKAFDPAPSPSTSKADGNAVVPKP